MKKRLLALLVLAATGFALAVLASPHVAAAQDTNTTPTVSTDTGSNANQSGDSGTFTVQDVKDTWWIILLLVGVLALAWVLPLVIDLLMAYRYQRMRMELFQNLLRDTTKRQPPLTPDEMKTLLNTNFVPASPSGLTGLSRGLMAMMIATAIAVALVALIAVGTNPDGLIKTIVTTLLAAFTTVVGFYFGARTAEGAQTAGQAAGVAAALAQPDAPGGGAVPVDPSRGPEPENPIVEDVRPVGETAVDETAVSETAVDETTIDDAAADETAADETETELTTRGVVGTDA
jgi:ABC-type multidrug transport system fused ATPase/permease subunit